MADNSTEVKRIIDIEFKGTQTIGDIKKNISQLKKELDQCQHGSKEAANKALELARAQNTLSAAMKGCVDESGKLDNSYNGLVTRMNRMKLVQKQLNLETDEGKKKFKEYAAEINKINNQLKDLDASNGVFTRNVGNYTSALGSLGGQFGKVASGIDKVSMSLRSLKAAGGWIAGVAAIIGGITMAIKTNEEAVERLQVAFAPFKGLFDGIHQSVQEFGDAMSKGLSKALNNARALTEAFLSAIGAQNALNRMRERGAIEREKQRLEDKELEYLKHQIERNEELTSWRTKMVKWRQNEEFVAKAISEIERLQKEDAEELYLLKRAQYDLLVKTNAQTISGKKEVKEELEAYNDMVDAAIKLTNTSEEFNTAIKKASGAEALKMINEELEKAQQHADDLWEEYNKTVSHADIQGEITKVKEELINTADSMYLVKRASNDMLTSELNAAYGLKNSLEYFTAVWDAENNAGRIAQEEYDRRAGELMRKLALQNEYIDKLQADQKEAQKKADEEAAEKAKKAADKLEQERQKLISQVNSKSSVLEQYVLAYFREFNAKRVEDLTIPQLQQILNSWDEVIQKDAEYFSNIMLEKLVPDQNKLQETVKKVERFKREMIAPITDETVEQRRNEILRFIGDIENGISHLNEEIEKIDLKGGENVDVEKAPLVMKLRRYTALLEQQQNKLKTLSKENIVQDMMNNVGMEFTIKMPIVVEEPEEEDIDKDLQKRISEIRNRIDSTLHQYNHETKSLKEVYEQQQKDLQIALNTKLITQEEYTRSMKNLDKEYLDAKKAIIYEEIGLYAELGSSIGSILGSIADMWEDDLRTKVEHGEMTEEQAKKEFEDVKAFQIAEAVISTITGAISGYAGAAGNSGINAIPLVGPALAQAIGIANAAAVTASGIAQIAKIKNTQFGSSSVSSGGYSGGNQSFNLPSLERYTPTYTRNITGESDTQDLKDTIKSAIDEVNIRSYVVESDISSAQHKSNKRKEEATF